MGEKVRYKEIEVYIERDKNKEREREREMSVNFEQQHDLEAKLHSVFAS